MKSKNGFKLPPHPYQIISWLIYCFHSVIPALFIYPHLGLTTSIIFLAIFYSSHLALLISGFLCTKSNPSIKLSKDPLYLETSENINFFCTICQSYVSRSSKHCGCCDRCVHRFDHHCKWLNNCIGEENYKLFISLLIVLLIDEAILLSFEIKVVSTGQEIPGFVLNIIDAVLNGVISVFLIYLIGVHIMLRCKGMTTYEYIKANRKRKKIKVVKEGVKVETKKLVEDQEAKDSVKLDVVPANKTVEEHPFSFSVPKASPEDLMHLTFQIHIDRME